MVHATLGRITRHKLGQRGTEKALQDCYKNETVDDGTRSTGVDLGDDTQS